MSKSIFTKNQLNLDSVSFCYTTGSVCRLSILYHFKSHLVVILSCKL